MLCRYCGCEIIWTESQGWNRIHFGTILWGTFECSSREWNPKLGHAPKEEE